MTHPHELTLERFFVDELPASERAAITGHVATCDVCKVFLQMLESTTCERLAAVPPERFVAQLSGRVVDHSRVLRRRSMVVGGAFMVAAAALFLLVPHGTANFRMKGLGVQIQRKRGAEVRVLAAADGIAAGDALQLIVTLPVATPVSAWIVDKNGRVDRIHDQSEPGSFIIDAPCIDAYLVVDVAAPANTEASLRARVAGGVPTSTDWWPPGAIVRPLVCKP